MRRAMFVNLPVVSSANAWYKQNYSLICSSWVTLCNFHDLWGLLKCVYLWKFRVTVTWSWETNRIYVWNLKTTWSLDLRFTLFTFRVSLEGFLAYTKFGPLVSLPCLSGCYRERLKTYCLRLYDWYAPWWWHCYDYQPNCGFFRGFVKVFHTEIMLTMFYSMNNNGSSLSIHNNVVCYRQYTNDDCIVIR